MHLEISHVVNDPIERVWHLLRDPEVPERALRGIETLETLAPDTAAVPMNPGAAAVKGGRDMKRSTSRQTRDRA
jgi:carbon monoxide dehydrogenase subunit G